MVVMKAVVVATFWMFPWMFTFANWALSWIQSDEAQLIVVMLIVPSKQIQLRPGSQVRGC